MTISTTTNRFSYLGNGVSKAFAYSSKFLANADLVVVLVSSAGVETTKTLTTHYTVTGAGDAGGGTVTMLTAPASGETLVLYGDPAITQTVDPTEGDDLAVDTVVETPLDRLTLICQRLANRIARCFQLTVGDATGGTVTAAPTDSTITLVGFDADGNLVTYVPVTLDLSVVSAFGLTLLDDADAITARATLGLSYGKQPIWVPAHAMIPRTTLPPAVGSTETATNKVMIRTLDFDAAADEFAQFSIRMPKSWNESTVTARFLWSHAAASTFDVIWGLQAVALSDGDTLEAAFGTAQTVTDSGGTTDDLYQSAETSAITIAGTPAEGDYVVFQVYRDANAAGDTLDVDARLHGVLLYFTNDAGNDD